MKNLEQIRAAAALRAVKSASFSRNDVTGLPALILINGLLPAAAFCCEGNKEARRGREIAFKSIAEYLSERGLTTAKTGSDLIRELSEKDNFTLQRATNEALAFLAYLKRFAPKERRP